MSLEKREKKNKIYRVYGSPYKDIDIWKSQGKSFALESTNLCKKVTFENGDVYLYCKQRYKNDELMLHKAVKKQFRDNIKIKELVPLGLTEKDVKYFMRSDTIMKAKIGWRLENCVGFDINKAYYRCAFNLGYIDEDFYNKCISLDKTLRLRLIGCVASSKTVFYFNNGVMNEEPFFKEDVVLRHAWFHICSVVDSCLAEFAELAGKRFLMYWVDGIYLEKHPKKDFYIDILEKLAVKYQLFFKEEKIEYIEKVVEKDDFGVDKCELLIMKDGEIKRHGLPYLPR